MLDFREMSIAGDDGATLHAWIHDGTTLPILLLHDLGMDATYWERFLEAALLRVPTLAVAALDLRGHGGSETGSETSRKRMVKDLRKWVGLLGIDPPIVVGHGYGADIALASDFVAAVIAVNPSLGREAPPVPSDLQLPVSMTGAQDAEVLRMCTVGAMQAKPLRRGRRDAPLFLIVSDPEDLDHPGLPGLREVCEDMQIWKSGSRHLPLEVPAGVAALVLEWIEEVR